MCICTSALFWTFLTLSRTVTETVTFKIEYEGLHADKVLINTPTQELKIKVKTKAFDLFRFTLTKDALLTLKQEDFVLKKTGTISKYSLPLEEPHPTWIPLGRTNGSIIQYSVDSMHLIYDELFQKKVKVISKYEVNRGDGAISVSVKEISPDSVVVKGSRSYLKNINFIETKDSSVHVGIEVKEIPMHFLLSNQVRAVEPSVVHLLVEVEKVEERTIVVPITSSNCPDSVDLKLFPNSAEVKFSSTKSAFKSILTSDFKMIVTYDDILAKEEKLYVNMVAFPYDLEDIKVTPAKADYLIRKK